MNLAKTDIHLLVVDDEQGMRDMMSLELAGQGYLVMTASNGEEALELIRRQKFDLVISDLMMPRMDGMALLENIKSFNPALEVIIATGHGSIEVAVAAMKNGAYDFILKPFNLDELNNLIEKALEKQKLKTMVALYEASNAIFSTLSLDGLLEIIMSILEKVMGADEASVMLVNEEKKLMIAASRGLSEEVARKVQMDIGERVAGTVANEKRARLLVNGLEKYPEFKDLKSNTRVLSSIICPLLCQGELVGVLNISRTKNACNFTASDLQSATIFASQVALAIQNAKLYANLQTAYHKIETTQSQLVQSEKLASIGRLVAGVAHELNNPLTAVIGYSQLALESRNLEDIHKQLPIVVSQAQRCSNIVKDLLLFARSQKPNFAPVDPCLLIKDILKGISLELEKREIAVEKDFPHDAILIDGDQHLLRQVFSNILNNSYQALEGISGGRKISIKVQAGEENMRFFFKDNGPGIPKEGLPKIFDPFYTTKEVGKGTGLGLSLAYGSIREHGGTISVESEPGKETIFTIELPLKAKGKMVQAPALERPKDKSFNLRADIKILVVEDEEPIRKLIVTIFSGQHYEVETADDGQDGLEKIKNKDYDLVLCDYRMPKLSGTEFYEKATLLKPRLRNRFLFITGSTEFMKNFETYFKGRALPFLLKPFTQAELFSAVNLIIKNAPDIKSKAAL